MHLKIPPKKQVFSAVYIIGTAFFVVAIFSLVPIFSVSGSYAKPGVAVVSYVLKNTEQSDPELPVRLKIPKINVNAPVSYVGITAQGAMGAPNGPFDVAWFGLGPRPGENGSAVIAGHYGRWKNGGGSVFDNLNRLKKGDKIYIEDIKGFTTTFVVRESKIYDPNANTGDVFYSMDGKAHLNLITCDGVWDNIRKTYSNRLIVFTEKE